MNKCKCEYFWAPLQQFCDYLHSDLLLSFTCQDLFHCQTFTFSMAFRSLCKLSVCGRGFYTCRITKVYHILQHAWSSILLREPSHKFKDTQNLQQERNSTKREGKKDRNKREEREQREETCLSSKREKIEKELKQEPFAGSEMWVMVKTRESTSRRNENRRVEEGGHRKLSLARMRRVCLI